MPAGARSSLASALLHVQHVQPPAAQWRVLPGEAAARVGLVGWIVRVAEAAAGSPKLAEDLNVTIADVG